MTKTGAAHPQNAGITNMKNNEEIILAIQTKGEITSSNFPAFAVMVRNRLSEINRELITDDEFGQADADAKAIAKAEADLKAAKAMALAGAEELQALFVGIEDLSSDLAKARLDLSKQIEKRKKERKTEIIEEALGKFDIDPRDARLKHLVGMTEATKGKRSFEAMEVACDEYYQAAQKDITESREIIRRFIDAHGPEMVMDKRDLELRKPDQVEAELRRRWDVKKAADEVAKAKLELEAERAKNAPPSPPQAEHAPWEAVKPQPAQVPTTIKSIDDEWLEFKATAKQAFGLLKDAKAKLQHSKNIAKAQGFANVVNSGWKEWA